MSLVDFEGFDAVTWADLAMAGWSLSPNAMTIVGGRYGGQALQTNNVFTFHGAISKNYGNRSTWIAGGALLFGSTPTVAQDIALFRWFDGATEQLNFRLASTHQLYIARGGTVLGISSYVAPLDTYLYIEFKVTFSTTVGVAVLTVNGNVVLNLTGVNTSLSGNAQASIFQFFDSNVGGQRVVLDDLYICDTAGSINNDFLGDQIVVTRLPSGAGNSTIWTPSAGSNYQTVDDPTPNGDTDYVSTSTAGNVDTYAIADPTGMTADARGVKTQVCARQDDSARTMQVAVRSGGTDYFGGTQSLTSSYLYYQRVDEIDPATGVRWTPAGCNAMQAGMKAIA